MESAHVGHHKVGVSRESREAYDLLVAAWLASGRASTPSIHADARSSSGGISIVEVVAAFWRHGQVYYRRPDGTPTKEAKNFRHALRPLKRLYGDFPAAQFGPVALRAVREEMVRRRWCRTHVNRQVNRLRQVFKWAAGRELLPASVYHALQAVEGLKAGRSDARESAPVTPVDEAHALAAAELMSPPVKAMVELQLITAMRPGEVIAMRACDIDTSSDDGTWTYTPATHKTAHHGHARQIILGPKARQILQPRLKPNMQGYIFSPADAVEAMRAKRRAARKTPLSCGNRPGSNVRRRPQRKPGMRYTVESYAHAIYQACDKAFPPPEPLARRRDETRAEWKVRLSADEKKALRQELMQRHPRDGEAGITPHGLMMEVLEEQTTHLLRHARLIRSTLACLLSTISCLTLCSMLSGLSVVWPPATAPAVALFLVGMALLLSGVVFAMLELRQALDPVELETEFVSGFTTGFASRSDRGGIIVAYENRFTPRRRGQVTFFERDVRTQFAGSAKLRAVPVSSAAKRSRPTASTSSRS